MNKQPIQITIAPRTIVLTLVIVAAIFLIFRLFDIVILVGFSILAAMAMLPSVRWLMRTLRIPKGLAIAILYLFVIVLSALIVVAVVPAVSNEVQSLIHNLPQLQSSISNYLSNTPWLQSAVNNSLNKLSQDSGPLVTRLASATIGVIVSVLGFFTVLILAAYFMAGGRSMTERILSVLPEKRWRERGLQISAHISDKLNWWLRGQLFLCFTIFVAHYVLLRLLGVPYALVLALLAGLLESIPTFGAWIAGIISTLVALAVSPGRAIAVAVGVLIIQQIEGNILTPQVMKRALGIPAAAVIIALLVFGKLLGLIGVVLAAPIAAVIAILFTEFMPDSRRWWRHSHPEAKSSSAKA